MYRTVAKRLFLGAAYGSGRDALTRFRPLRCLSSSVNSQSFANQTSNPNQHQHAPDYSHSTSSSSSSNSSTAEEARHRHSQRPRLEYQEEQARVLGKSLPYVVRLQSTTLPLFCHFFFLWILQIWVCKFFLSVILTVVEASVLIKKFSFWMNLLQLKLGWTEAALIAGAKDAGVSPAIIGSFPRKEAALVEVYHFGYYCLWVNYSWCSNATW